MVIHELSRDEIRHIANNKIFGMNFKNKKRYTRKNKNYESDR